VIAAILADVILVVHLIFILFSLFGGLLVLKYRWFVWLHLPAMCWAATISFAGWICPLTPLEVALRRAAGEEGYAGGFVAHYIAPLIYPHGYTRALAITVGFIVIAINLIIYGIVLQRARKERQF